MFSRIFNLNQKKDKIPSSNEDSQNETWKTFQEKPRMGEVKAQDIRILIYKDCERRDDKILVFDSQAVVPVGDTSQRSTTRTSCKVVADDDGQTYQCLKPASDVKMLGEMIFGSVAMVYKGAISKVHVMRSSKQLLMSKVFALRSRSAGVNFCESELENCDMSSSIDIKTPVHSLKNNIRSFSNPTTFIPSYGGSPASVTSVQSCTQLSTSHTSTHSLSSVSSRLNASAGCLQRRFNRFQRTSLDSPCMWRSRNHEELSNSHKQQPKIGIGVLINRCADGGSLEKFFFSHYPLIEAHLQTLRVKIEKSFCLRQKFFHAAYTAIDTFKDELLTLFYTPRIFEPIWLRLSEETGRDECIDKFTNSFMKLIEICETKDNNYFLSTLLTAVLCHHTSWVATVMSNGSTSKRAYLDKHSSKALGVLAKCHPYNPLWAQLCDLYGSLNLPLQLSRTIIVGRNKTLVSNLLQLLTYFIRCSHVTESAMTVDQSPDTVTSWKDSVESWVENSLDNRDNSLGNIKKRLDFTSNAEKVDFTCCYCHILQKLDTVSKKSLSRHLKTNADVRTVKLEQLNNVFSTNLRKSCFGCGSLEKLLYASFCDQCSKTSGELSCLLCIENLEQIKQLEEKPANKKKSTFVCYCCTEETIIKPTTITEEHVYRPRNFSDPITCGKVELRSSTEESSTDSGVLTRLDSVSSQATVDSSVCSVIDSDYCSESDVSLEQRLLKTHVRHDPSLCEDLTAMQLKHVPLLRTKTSQEDSRFSQTNFGTSLFAGYNEKYSANFVLQGVPSIDEQTIARDLNNSVEYSVLDDDVINSVCIIADTDNWSCDLWSCTKQGSATRQSDNLLKTSVYASDLVTSLVESTKELWDMSIPASYCLLHVEEQLKDIYNRGLVLNHVSTSVSNSQRYHDTDLELLRKVGATYYHDNGAISQ